MPKVKGITLIWLALTMVALLVGFDLVLPVRFFRLWLWIILGASILAGLLFMAIRHKVFFALNISSGHRFLLTAIALGLLAAGIYFPRVLSEKALISAAPEDFNVIIHGSIHQQNINHTLLQLEKGLRGVREASGWEAGRTALIRVELYPDVYELQCITGLEDWASGFTIYTPDGPVIHIPVVMDASGIDETPEHEVVHAVMYQHMGAAIYELPNWFREGMARYLSQTGVSRLPSRAVARFQLWQEKDVAMSPGDFNQFSLDDASIAGTEISFFYDCAHELIRYFIAEFGVDMPWQVMEQVTGGSSFNQAFSGIAGKGLDNCYSDWVLKFWGRVKCHVSHRAENTITQSALIISRIYTQEHLT